MPQTIKIKSDHFPRGYLIINASDFDPATMEPYEEPRAATPEAPTPEPEPTSDAPTASVDEPDSRPRMRSGRTERA